MTTVDVEEGRVVVRFTGRHAIMALARSLAIPVADVRAVSVVPNGWDLELGRRVGGTGLPGRLAFGRFRDGGVRTFAAIYSGQPALLIETHGNHWNRVVLALDDPEDAAQRVRGAAGL